MVISRDMKARIERSALSVSLRLALRRSRAVALIGPRQVGKTTIARTFVAPASANYFDLEDPRDLERLAQPICQSIIENFAESRELAILRDTLLPKLLSGEVKAPAVTP